MCLVPEDGDWRGRGSAKQREASRKARQSDASVDLRQMVLSKLPLTSGRRRVR